MNRRMNRYELKYMVHASRYHAFVRDLLNFMSPDPHGDGDGFYRITSLYYDGPTLQCYRAKVDGLDIRQKVRLRVYPGSDHTTVTSGCVEIKNRFNRTVKKERLFLPLDRAHQLLRGDSLEGLTNPQDLATAAHVQYLIRSMALRPMCIVSYRRQAFVGSRYESKMRLTFDMDLTGRVHALDVTEQVHNHRFIPLDWLVMEVKVDERIPSWTTALLAKHECVAMRVSKYCLALADGMRRLERSQLLKENIYG